MFPNIPFFSYILTTVLFVPSSRNTFIAMVNTVSFKGIEKVVVKSLLSMEMMIISEINLTSIFKVIVNLKFIVIILF